MIFRKSKKKMITLPTKNKKKKMNENKNSSPAGQSDDMKKQTGDEK